MVWDFGTVREARRQAIRTNRGCLMKSMLGQIPDELRKIILDFQYSKSTNPYEIMKTGWDSIPACRWRVNKFHAEEADDLIQDEEHMRESIEWAEEDGRQIEILWLTYKR